MAFTERSNDGPLSGTTPVTVVSAPSSGSRHIIRYINLNNLDANPVTASVYLKNGVNARNIWKGVLNFGDTWIFGDGGDVCVLDATNKSIEAVLDTNPGTQPTFIAVWGEET